MKKSIIILSLLSLHCISNAGYLTISCPSTSGNSTTLKIDLDYTRFGGGQNFHVFECKITIKVAKHSNCGYSGINCKDMEKTVFNQKYTTPDDYLIRKNVNIPRCESKCACHLGAPFGGSGKYDVVFIADYKYQEQDGDPYFVLSDTERKTINVNFTDIASPNYISKINLTQNKHANYSFSWNEAVDQPSCDASGIKHYEVYLNDVLHGTTSENSYTISSIPACVNNEIGLVVVDKVGLKSSKSIFKIIPGSFPSTTYNSDMSSNVNFVRYANGIRLLEGFQYKPVNSSAKFHLIYANCTGTSGTIWYDNLKSSPVVNYHSEEIALDTDFVESELSAVSKSEGLKINIYPNPTCNIFYVQFNEDAYENVISIAIINSIGQLVEQHKDVTNLNTIDLTGYSSGIYTVCIKQKEKITNLKLIKK